MSSTVQGLLSADEFWALPGEKRLRELVRGEVIDKMPPGGVHGRIASRLAARLQLWSEGGPLGNVAVESGYRLARNPDTVRGPDISYIRQQRIPMSGIPLAFWNLAPDLAVEVVSPEETAANIQAKVEEYLDAGTELVWLVYANTRSVVVIAHDRTGRTLRGDDVLEDARILPGFSCHVSELFA